MHQKDPKSMSLGDHLEELRARLLYALLGLMPIFGVSLMFGKSILAFLLRPAERALLAAGQPDEFLGLGPLEVLGAYLKVSVVITVVLGTPWVLYQLWKFVAPGLYMHERRYVYFLLPLSAVLTVSGVYFLYRVILPVMLAWLIAFGTDIGARGRETADLPKDVTLRSVPVLAADPPAKDLKVGDEWVNTSLLQRRVCVGVRDGVPDILAENLRKESPIVQQFSIEKYVSLLFTLTLAFAGIFQVPVVVLLLGWVGLIDHTFVRTYRKHAILACAVVAALISPGDPASLVLLWAPLVVLWELGGVLLRLFPAHKVAGPRPELLEGEG